MRRDKFSFLESVRDYFSVNLILILDNFVHPDFEHKFFQITVEVIRTFIVILNENVINVLLECSVNIVEINRCFEVSLLLYDSE